MRYAVFFGYNNDKNVFRLPTNPEQIDISSTQAVEKYDILKSGQIAVPGDLELKEFSFECEFPLEEMHYIETHSKFKTADWYLQRFEFWRKKKTPFRFIAGRTDKATMATMEEDSINSLCLIEEMTVTEKAGEEGDKYVSFKLVEFKEFGKRFSIIKEDKSAKKKATTTQKVNPKANSTYVVKSGDSLWAIAKKLYGDGAKANILYHANKNLIKNPNLIKPGQKLVVPSEGEFSKYDKALPTAKKSTTKMAVSSYSQTVSKQATTSNKTMNGNTSIDFKNADWYLQQSDLIKSGNRIFNIKTGAYSSGGGRR